MRYDIMKYKSVNGVMGELKGRKFSKFIGDREMVFFVQGDKRSNLGCISDYVSGRKICQFYIAKERDMVEQAKDAVSDFANRVGIPRFQAIVDSAEKVNV